MPKEPGEPTVHVTIDATGVRLTVEATLTGREDWERELAEPWFGELWAKVQVVAVLHADYGFLSPCAAPPPLEPSPNPAPTPLHEYTLPALGPAARTQAEQQRLNTAIERAEENGHLVPRQKREHQQLNRWKNDLVRDLRRNPRGLTRAQINERSSGVGHSAISLRLKDLQDAQLIYFHEEGGHNRGFWRATVPRESEMEAALRPDILTAALPYTRGKRFLMLGGGGDKPHRKELIEKALSLAELRWPVIDEAEPVETWLKEIRRPEIDVVIINRWTQKKARFFIHEAQEWEKPFLYLTHGYSAIQIAQAIQAQWVQRRPQPQEQCVGVAA